MMKYIDNKVLGWRLPIDSCVIIRLYYVYQIIDEISDAYVDGIIHRRFVVVIVLILKKIERTMNRAYHIIGKTRVFFVFTNFGGNRVPKGDDGEEIFNVKHTERMRSHGANAERMRSHGVTESLSHGANAESRSHGVTERMRSHGVTESRSHGANVESRRYDIYIYFYLYIIYCISDRRKYFTVSPSNNSRYFVLLIYMSIQLPSSISL